MKYVYLLQSLSHPEQRYIGLTADLDQRRAAHNAGQSPHTATYRPWALAGYTAFAGAGVAVEERKAPEESGAFLFSSAGDQR